MVVLAMSHGELSRFDTMMRVERGELRVTDAAALLGLKRRQVYRLLDRLREDGAEGMISRKRGRPGNRRHSDALREQIMAIVREHYHDFGPTLAREYLIKRHDIRVSCETLLVYIDDATSTLRTSTPSSGIPGRRRWVMA